MIATATWRPDTTHYQARSQSNHPILFDTDAAHTAGPSPMEAVLACLCACTSVDVVSILQKKRQPLAALTVSAAAEQAPAPPRVFTRITLTYTVGSAPGAQLSRKAVEDAVALSKDKYCSVSKMLEASVAIDYAIEYADGAPLP